MKYRDKLLAEMTEEYVTPRIQDGMIDTPLNRYRIFRALLTEMNTEIYANKDDAAIDTTDLELRATTLRRHLIDLKREILDSEV